MTPTCALCPQPVKARGLCSAHYSRAARAGTITPRRGQRGPIPHGERSGHLEALCWCEATIVTVPATDIRKGRTGTCGDPRCTPTEGSTP